MFYRTHEAELNELYKVLNKIIITEKIKCKKYYIRKEGGYKILRILILGEGRGKKLPKLSLRN